MSLTKYVGLLAGTTLGLSAAAMGASAEANSDTNQQIQQLRKEIAELKAAQGDQWLTQERAKEIRGIVQDVLADADTRASLQSTGATSGYDNGFFIASPDGNFKLVVNGQLQIRYAASRLSTRSIGQLDPGTYQQPAQGFNSANGGGSTIQGPVNSSGTQQQYPGGTEIRGYQGFFGGGNAGVERTAKGFEIPRAKLEFSGHVVDPCWQYKIVGAFEQQSNQAGFNNVGAAVGGNGITAGTLGPTPFASGTYGGNYSGGNGSLGSNFGLEDAYIKKIINNNWSVTVGQFKAPLLREELVSSKYQLAVERSLVNQFFSEEYTQGFQVTYQDDMFRFMASFNDGGNNANTSSTIGTNSTFGNFTEYALTGRFEWKVMGNWAQFEDFSSPRGDPTGILIGAAVNWQRGGGAQTVGAPNLAPTFQNAGGGGSLGGNFPVQIGLPVPGPAFAGYAPGITSQYPNNIPTNANDDVSNITWTVDASGEFGGFNLYAALVGNIAYNIPAGWVANPSGGYLPATQGAQGGLGDNFIPGNWNGVMTTPGGSGPGQNAGVPGGSGIGPNAYYAGGYGYGNDTIFSYGVVVQGGFFITDDVELFARYEWYNTNNNGANDYAGNTPTFWGFIPGGSSPFADNTTGNNGASVFYPNGLGPTQPSNVNNGVESPNDAGYTGNTTNPYYSKNLGANPYGAQSNSVITGGVNWYPAGVKNKQVKVTGDIGWSLGPVLFGQGIYGRPIGITDYRNDGGLGGGGQWVGRIQLQLLF